MQSTSSSRAARPDHHRRGCTRQPHVCSRKAVRNTIRQGTLVPPVRAASGEGLIDTDALAGFKVLVAGATGRTGRRVVEVLVEQGVPVRALVRDERKARALLPGLDSGLVEIARGDVFQYATLPRALGDANAVICATGATDISDPLAPYNVDFQGTCNLVALARQRALNKFVLVTSIGTDELLNPLNLFWGVLFWKKRAEEELQRSGLDYTIIRPGGLKESLKAGEAQGGVVMQGPGFYGVPPKGKAGSILRRQVAELCVSSLYEPGAANKVVEVIAVPNQPQQLYGELFDNVLM